MYDAIANRCLWDARAGFPALMWNVNRAYSLHNRFIFRNIWFESDQYQGSNSAHNQYLIFLVLTDSYYFQKYIFSLFCIVIVWFVSLIVSHYAVITGCRQRENVVIWDSCWLLSCLDCQLRGPLWDPVHMSSYCLSTFKLPCIPCGMHCMWYVTHIWLIKQIFPSFLEVYIPHTYNSPMRREKTHLKYHISCNVIHHFAR